MPNTFIVGTVSSPRGIPLTCPTKPSAVPEVHFCLGSLPPETHHDPVTFANSPSAYLNEPLGKPQNSF